MIGLLGAHRVGKSTLALTAAATFNLKYVPVSISKMQEKHGFDSSDQSYPFGKRMIIQEHLYHDFERLLHTTSAGARFVQSVHKAALSLNKEEPKITEYIFDRTPLDLIGYTLIHAGDQLTERQSKWLLDYIQRCIDLTNKYFKSIVQIQPGIPLVSAETSAKASLGMMEHLNAIYMAYLLDPRIRIRRDLMPREITDMVDRLNFLKENQHV